VAAARRGEHHGLEDGRSQRAVTTVAVTGRDKMQQVADELYQAVEARVNTMRSPVPGVDQRAIQLN
jgi:hypothetical protein